MLAIFLWGEQAGHPKPEELGQGRSGAEWRQRTRVFAELCMKSWASDDGEYLQSRGHGENIL